MPDVLGLPAKHSACRRLDETAPVRAADPIESVRPATSGRAVALELDETERSSRRAQLRQMPSCTRVLRRSPMCRRTSTTVNGRFVVHGRCWTTSWFRCLFVGAPRMGAPQFAALRPIRNRRRSRASRYRLRLSLLAQDAGSAGVRAGPRASGMRRWRAGPYAHPTQTCRANLTTEPPTRSSSSCTTADGVKGAFASRCDGLRPPLTPAAAAQEGWLSGRSLSLVC